jgi:carbon starvation protein
MTTSIRILIWLGVAIFGALALGTIARHRVERINALWLVVAAFCAYALGHRFYSKFIFAKALALDAGCPTLSRPQHCTHFRMN